MALLTKIKAEKIDMKDNYRNYEIVSKQPIVYFWHPEGAIKKVRVVDCDFDKRVTMVCVDTGEGYYYKWGYVYDTYEDVVANQNFDYEAWSEGLLELDTPACIDPWKLLLSNKNYAKYKKLKRKERSSATQWYVSVDNESYYNSKHFKTQKAALKYFGSLDETMIEFALLGEWNTGLRLLEFENDTLWILEHDHEFSPKSFKNRTLKSRHVGKEETYKDWRK